MKKRIVLFIVLSLFVISACGETKEEVQPTMSQEVGDFEAITQDDESFNVRDLQGKWWVADFVFTNCTTVCLPMTTNMALLQDKLNEADIENVHLVSFSVDPDHDSPEVLKEYAEEYGADLSNWTFLTGYDFETIKEYSIKTFKNLVEAPPEGDDQVTHGTAFFLVNPDGNIIKHYKGIQADAMDDIVEDLKNLQ